jgi:hypothetical protein
MATTMQFDNKAAAEGFLPMADRIPRGEVER